MFNIISKLSNAERLSGFIKPYTDRVDKMNQLAAVFDKFLTAELDSNSNGNIDLRGDEWTEFYSAFQTIVNKTGDSVIFTDPLTNYTTVINFDLSDDYFPIQCFSAYSDGSGGYINRANAFLFAERSFDNNNEIYYSVTWLPNNLRNAKPDPDSDLVSIDSYAEKLQDQINCYNISLDAITMTVKNKMVNAADFVTKLRTNYVGLRGGALELSQSLTTALTTHDVASVAHVLGKYMNPVGTTVNSDGSVNFPTTTPTTELEFGAVIASGIPALITTLGTVISAVSKPIGIAITGFGYIASAATNAINTVANDSVRVVLSTDSENTDIGIKVVQNIYRDSEPSERGNRNIIQDLISHSGYQPHKYEIPGITGYVWPVDYTGTTASGNTCTMAHESYLSCRGYIKHEFLLDLIDEFFTVSRTSYSYSGGYGRATVRIQPLANVSMENFLAAMYANYIPYDFDELKAMDDDEINFAYQKAVLTDCVLGTLLYALTSKIFDSDQYTDFVIPIDNHHPYPESVSVPYNMFCIGVQFICDPFHDTYDSQPMLSWDGDAQDWDTNPYLTTGFEMYNEVQMGKISVAVDSLGIPDDYDRKILSLVRWISQNALTLYDVSTGELVDCSFQFFPVVQRFDFRMRPPKWTRRSLVANAILTGVIIAAVAVIATIATVKINSWRKKKALETQAQTEAAWDKLKESPTPENLKAYRKACLKQNTLGKIYGCSSVSNTNYWGSTEQPSTNVSAVSEQIQNSIPEVDISLQVIKKLITGLD